MIVRFTLLDLNEVTKRLATEDMPAKGAPYEEWQAWRARWIAGLGEVMAASTRHCGTAQGTNPVADAQDALSRALRLGT